MTPTCCNKPMVHFRRWVQCEGADYVARVSRDWFECICGREVDVVGENLVEREREGVGL